MDGIEKEGYLELFARGVGGEQVDIKHFSKHTCCLPCFLV